MHIPRTLILLLALLLTACGGRQAPAPAAASRPEPVAPPAKQVVATTAPGDQNCPPPSPPVYHSVPAPHYVDIHLDPERPTADRGQPMHFTATLRNVHGFAITLDKQALAMELKALPSNPDTQPVWHQAVSDWPSVTLQPGQELTAEGVWPGGDPGYYALSFSPIKFAVACREAGAQIGPGTTIVEVRLPSEAVLTATLAPEQAVSAEDITVRVDQVELKPDGTRVTLWVSKIRSPAALGVSLLQDGTPAFSRGLGNKDAAGGGVQVFADFAPTPKGTRHLTVEVSDVGLTEPGVGMHYVHGPWRLSVELPTP